MLTGLRELLEYGLSVDYLPTTQVGDAMKTPHVFECKDEREEADLVQLYNRALLIRRDGKVCRVFPNGRRQDLTSVFNKVAGVDERQMVIGDAKSTDVEKRK